MQNVVRRECVHNAEPDSGLIPMVAALNAVQERGSMWTRSKSVQPAVIQTASTAKMELEPVPDAPTPIS